MFFHIRTFESPIDGLSFVKDTAAPQRNAFRKKTVEAVCDPILQQIERVKKIRKKTHKGTVKYPEMQQDLSEVRNRLKEIMTEARLRRIPIEFKHKYHKNLYALQSCYRATHALEDSFAQETPAARERLYKESIKLTHKARRQCLESRDYFAGDGWRTATPKQDKKPLPSDDERGFPKSRSTR